MAWAPGTAEVVTTSELNGALEIDGLLRYGKLQNDGQLFALSYIGSLLGQSKYLKLKGWFRVSYL
jgi:hypothetical protein